MMEYTTLGKTGITVSVAGLGCGGFSKLGRGTGRTESESVDIVRNAMDLGINFIDTAAAYGTETIVGKAISGRNRDEVVISTKAQINDDEILIKPEAVIRSLEGSLKKLGTDYVDVFHLHGVSPGAYEYALKDIVPLLLREKEKGKFRCLGITESATIDATHATLRKAVKEDCFDVIMVAFHMMHQSACKTIFPHTRTRGIGVLDMFAVRLVFSRLDRLKSAVRNLVAEDKLPSWLVERDNPLDFLVHPGGARNVVDAAYRYCRHEPGTDVILSGTGNVEHLKSNVNSILSGPLPREDLQRITELFGHLEGVGLVGPKRDKK
jgi:aryl-alcohol dehydrogenase-like predicted oxidoreductase